VIDLARGECGATASPDTWDVTRERINRLWSVQMQLSGRLRLPAAAARHNRHPRRPARNRIKSKAIIAARRLRDTRRRQCEMRAVRLARCRSAATPG